MRSSALLLCVLALTGCASSLPDPTEDPKGFVTAVCQSGLPGGMTVDVVDVRPDIPEALRGSEVFYEATGHGTVRGVVRSVSCLMSIRSDGTVGSSPSYGWQD